MKQAREELTRFRSEIKSLTRQMDGMALDIKESKKRVCAYTDRLVEIEQDLTATQEVNVNLQVLLENAVKTQKESDVFATQAIRTMYFDLASVVQGNNRLQGRLASIESHQREHKGNLHDVVRRIREYTQMLEQAQGTIHMLQEPQMTPTIKIHEDELSISSIGGSSRRTSEAFSSYTTEEDEGYPYAKESHLPDRSPSLPGLLSPKAAELYRYRFIHRRISLPPSVSPPQWQEQQMPSHEDLRVPMPDQERRGSLTAERK
ncbi:hypothetical protein DFQ30_001155 [Apophysomyces sp. BC1015]|nr:hypothetical protein DFQ30_001155 [Apophysomyces sp. BC1015]